MALVTVQRSPSPSNTASEDAETEDGSNLKSPNRSRSFSESYFTVKGAALILPQNDVESTYTKKVCKNSYGDIQSHLESMITLLRRQDTIAVAVKLEVGATDRHKYMAVVSCMGKQDTEESVILGIDFDKDNHATIGLVLPIWADTDIELDGDGGFRIMSSGNRHLFKPVTVQVMWFTLQSLNKLVKIARENKYITGGLSHTWVSYYESSITSDIPRISDWNMTEDLLFFKAEPVLLPTDDDSDVFLKKVTIELKNVMMREDLDEATSKYLRTKLEEQMNMKLDKWKGYIDKQMLTILGQMDSPTLVKDYLYLGSEWNASNIEELTENKVHYIMNISREIDNFFPGILHYYNIKEWDCEETDLLKHWENTHKYISKVRDKKNKVLVHCKMGISRSASTVLAYLMKEYNMTRQEAYDYVREKRSCIMPNKAFWHQLEIYEGILSASNQRHLFKKKSELNIAEQTKEEKDEEINADLFLDAYQEHIWNKNNLEESYPDVFLKDISDSCSYDFDAEIGSSSRSADSNEAYYPDLPSPQPEGATGGAKDFPSQDSDESESSEEEEGIKSEDNRNLSPTTKVPSDFNTVPVIGSPKFKANKDLLTSVAKETTEETVDKVQENDGQNDIDIAEIEGDCDLDSDKSREATSMSDFGIHQHYVKENIPWSAGTVKKTKEDLEGKLKDSPPSSRPNQLVDNVNPEVKGENITIIVTDQTKSEHFFQTIDDITDSETNDDKVQDVKSVDKVQDVISVDKVEDIKSIDTVQDVKSSDKVQDVTSVDKVQDVKSGGEVQDLKSGDEDENAKGYTSVYDMEDISLPPGIVRKTTQEIEERNRSNDESQNLSHMSLQRSSSLKTERDTPRKKRDLERRKTITPILSPCTSSGNTSPTKDVSMNNSSGYDTLFQSQCQSQEQENDKKESAVDEKKDLDQNNSTFADKDSDKNLIKDEENLEEQIEPDLAVYKFLGEEVSVEKGIVKKQKMGIELMSRERLSSEPEKSESGTRSRKTSDNEGTSSSPTTPTEGRKTNKETSSASNILTSALSSEQKTLSENSEGVSENQKDDLASKERMDSESEDKDDSGVEERTPVFSEAKESFERASAKNKENDQSFHTPKCKKKTEPRFDSATLELIREIGSAILNSPAKAEVENFEEEEAQLGSGLVRHYVKNIEKKTKVIKKKNAKKIIIIDKESQEKRKPWRWSSPVEQESSSTDQSDQKDGIKKPLKQSTSSPILSSRQLINMGNRKSSESEFASVAGGSPEKTGAFMTLLESVSCSDEKTSDEDKNDEVLGVKSLVGKYESSNEQFVGSPSSCSSLPEIKEVASCESLKTLETKDTNIKENESESRESDIEESTNEDCVNLRKIRNQLRKTSIHTHRPKSVELGRRNSSTLATGWVDIDTEDNQSGFSWEGKKVRKLRHEGKTHPLTKLQWRAKFYNTM